MFHGKIAIAMLFHVMMQCEGALIPLKDREGKVSLLEWTNYNYREPEGQGTYAFGYDIEDPDTNNIQFRNEEKLSNGSVVGSYGYLQPTGDAFVVKYIADEGGYRATVENPSKIKYLKTTQENPHGFKTTEQNDNRILNGNNSNGKSSGTQDEISSNNFPGAQNQRLRDELNQKYAIEKEMNKQITPGDNINEQKLVEMKNRTTLNIFTEYEQNFNNLHNVLENPELFDEQNQVHQNPNSLQESSNAMNQIKGENCTKNSTLDGQYSKSKTIASSESGYHKKSHEENNSYFYDYPHNILEVLQLDENELGNPEGNKFIQGENQEQKQDVQHTKTYIPDRMEGSRVFQNESYNKSDFEEKFYNNFKSKESEVGSRLRRPETTNFVSNQGVMPNFSNQITYKNDKNSFSITQPIVRSLESKNILHNSKESNELITKNEDNNYINKQDQRNFNISAYKNPSCI